MALQFRKATKERAKLRLAFVGPAGSGKTYSALAVGRALVGPEGRIAVMDTEHGSASKYADLFAFDALEPDHYSPEVYIDAIHAAEQAGYDLLIIDSLSHAWTGKGGALEMVDEVARRNKGNSYVGWRDVTPLHNRMVDAMLAAGLHLIVTMRSKTEYVLEENERGKKVPRKIGMQPVQRDGLEYEFDVVGDLDHENTFVVSKSRCPALSGAIVRKPGANLAATLAAWLDSGAEPAKPLVASPDEREALMAACALFATASLDAKAERGVAKASAVVDDPQATSERVIAATEYLNELWAKIKPRTVEDVVRAEHEEQDGLFGDDAGTARGRTRQRAEV